MYPVTSPGRRACTRYRRALGFVVAPRAHLKVARHDSHCASIDQWFADESVIEDDGSVDGGDSRFIPTGSNAGVHPTENS